MIQAYQWTATGMKAYDREPYGVMQYVRADDVDRLVDAVTKLYFAAHWSPDRSCDAVALWTAVRDAATIEPGQTMRVLGPPRGHDYRKLLQEFIDLCAVGDVDENTDEFGWGNLIKRAKEAVK